MYIIEIITNDNRETLLKRETAETWEDANNIIEDIQNYELDNIKIDLYKQTKQNDPEYLGDFTNIKPIEHIPETKKKNNNLIVAGAGLLLTPIMIINRLVKK